MKKSLLALAALLILGFAFSFAENPHTPRAPIVVAQQTILNQTGGLASQTLYTPASEGTFRLSLYITTGQCAFSGGSTVQVGYTWNDGLDNRVKYSGSPGCNGIGYASNPADLTQVLHVASGDPIAFSIVAFDSTDSFNYYITLEEL